MWGALGATEPSTMRANLVSIASLAACAFSALGSAPVLAQQPLDADELAADEPVDAAHPVEPSEPLDANDAVEPSEPLDAADSVGATETAESVVLLAPDDVRAEWTAALQLELAARGAVAIPAEVPQAATSLLGDAAAQRVAIERGARAAVWVEARQDAWRLRMVSPTAERARVVPVAREADARTVALIVVSLLDAPQVPAEVPVAAAVPEPPAAALDPPDAQRELPSERAPRREPYVHWSGVVGVAGFSLANDQRADFGLTLRGGIAMRYDAFEAAVVHDLGGYLQESQFGGLQPYARLCLEAGAATPRTSAAFHAGARGCFGSVFALETANGPGRTIFFSQGPRTHVSGGGYVAVSFPLVDLVRLFLRADLDIAWTDFALFDGIDAVPSLSALLTFG